MSARTFDATVSRNPETQPAAPVEKPWDPKRGVSALMKASGLGRDKVRQLIREGRLPGYKIDDRYVVPEEAFRIFCRGEFTPRQTPTPTPIVSADELIRRRRAS